MKPAYTADQIRNILHAARAVLFPESVRQGDDPEPVVYRLVLPDGLDGLHLAMAEAGNSNL